MLVHFDLSKAIAGEECDKKENRKLSYADVGAEDAIKNIAKTKFKLDCSLTLMLTPTTPQATHFSHSRFLLLKNPPTQLITMDGENDRGQ